MSCSEEITPYYRVKDINRLDLKINITFTINILAVVVRNKL